MHSMYVRVTHIHITVFDLISEHALISGHPFFPEILKKVQSRLAITHPVIMLIGCNAVMYYICSSYFKCFN